VNLIRLYRSWAADAPFGDPYELDVYDFVEGLYEEGDATFRTADAVRNMLEMLSEERFMAERVIDDVVARAVESGLVTP